jgi:general nucleoside transport system permease protein
MMPHRRSSSGGWPYNRLRQLHIGAAGALGPALQSIGVTSGYYLYNAAPYALTLLIMIINCRPDRTLTGAPGELSLTR